MNKKTLILILLALILLVGGVSGYYLFIKKTQTITPPNNPGQFAFGNQVNNAVPGPGNTPLATAIIDTSVNEAAEQNEISLQKLEPASINNSDIIIAMTGGVVFDSGTSTVVRYMERGTGHIFERTFSSSTPLGNATEISNTTIPRVQETLWIPGGDSLLVRYAKTDSDEIDTFYGKLIIATSSESEPGSIDGNFLDANILELITGGKNKIFGLENVAGQGIGFISNPDGKKQTTVFKSPLTEWIPTWPKESTVTLTTKASSQASGFLFFINTTNGSQKKILGGINGLTTLTNPDASYILYSESQGQGFTLNIFNVKTGDTNLAPIQTLPEKCLWSHKDTASAWCLVPRTRTSATYPDDWYQGKISSSDNIWKINVKTGESELLVSVDNGITIDGINLFTDNTEDHLFFTNKKNDVLWSFDLR
ncbi:MAG: hypothetical protein PHS53_01605 [Candidatus Pacebacteria bacterium]|nr:hypothetical protein [Candidatus Paceibacterota bacterium]